MFNSTKHNKIVRTCLLLFLIHFLLISSVHGQTSRYATYECRVKIDSQGNGVVSMIYGVFAGDQSLQISSVGILFPVYNSTAILEGTINVKDIYGRELSWSWENSKEYLKVLIDNVNIPAGGKYEVRASYNQQYLSRIFNETHYFVYEWDFSRIMYSPYTITQYTIEVERPADTLFDTYPINYISASPVSLNNYITQHGSVSSLTYSLSISKVTMNVYYRHEIGFPMFAVLTITMIALSIAMALYFTKRRPRPR